MKRLFLAFGLALICVSALGQETAKHGTGDPRQMDPVPPCKFTKVWIDDVSGTAYTAKGDPCVWTPITGLPDGVASDGANGITVTGAVAAGAVVAPLQPMNAYALRSTRTKAALITLNQAGYSGYTSPSQMYIAMAGDSTGTFHAAEVACTLGVQYSGGTNALAGYIGGVFGTVTLGMGFNCPSGGAFFTPALSGGAYVIDGSVHPWDFSHTINGSGWVVPPGGSLTQTVAVQSTRQLVLYTADVATVNVTVSTSTDNATWTPLTNVGGSVCDGAATAHVGGVCDIAIAGGKYYLKVAASGTGNLYVVTAGQVDTTVNGVVYIPLLRGGMSFPDEVSVPDALTAPWYAALHPDLITTEWKHNPTVAPGSVSGCNYSVAAAPTTYQPWSYWYGAWAAKWQAANPLVDFLAIGSYDSVSSGASCDATQNQQTQAWARGAVPPQTYVDLYSQATNAQMQSLGWIDTSVHQTALGQVADSDLLMQYLGILNWPTASVSQVVNNSSVTTNKLTLGTVGYVDYNTSAPYYWRFRAQRGFNFANPSGTVFAQLCDPSNTPCVNVDKSFLPPFQLGNTSNNMTSGVWLAVNAAGYGGAFTAQGATVPVPWAASNVFLGTSTGTTATPTFDANQHYFYESLTANVTSETITNSSLNPPDATWVINNPTGYTWAWNTSGTGAPMRGAMRVPVIPAATNQAAECTQMFRGWSGGFSHPKAPAVCYYGSALGGSQVGKTFVLADGLLTGTTANTDGAGEISLSAATTASYTFAITTYTVHPECQVTPQFDPGSGVRWWITYTAGTSFTVNFSSAVTGAVSYHCDIRT